MSSVGSSSRLRPVAPAFLILLSSDADGRKSETAAAITRTSAPGTPAGHASRELAAVSTLDHPHALGRLQRHVGGDQRDLGAAAAAPRVPPPRPSGPRSGCPRSAPSRSARGCRRRSPAHAPRRATGGRSRRPVRARSRRSTSAGSARRPAPHSPSDASRPVPGSTIVAPTQAQRLDVAARGGVIPHVVVHRGGQHQRLGAGQRGAEQQVVGVAAGQLGQRVGRGGRDRVGVAAAHQLEVGDGGVIGRGVAGKGASSGVGLELVHQHGRAGDPLERGPARRTSGWPASASRARRARRRWPGARSRRPCRPRSPR